MDGQVKTDGDMRAQLSLVEIYITDILENVRYTYDPNDILCDVTIAITKLTEVQRYLVAVREDR